MHSYEARAIYKSREAGSGDSRRATARVPTPLHTTPALTRLCWRMRLRGDSHPPAGRPRGSPLLWTGLESRFPRGIVGATLVVARLDRSMLVSFCIPSVIRQRSPAAAHPGREWVRAVQPPAAQPAPTPYL